MNIEELIKKAIEEGKFQDLPGQGKPLKLEENPFEDPTWRVANKIIKDGGFSPIWIETRKEIEAEIETAKKFIQLAHEEYISAGGSRAGFETQTGWKLSRRQFLDRIHAINKMIFQYNIQTPTIQVQMRTLDAAVELEKAIHTGANDVSSTLS